MYFIIYFYTFKSATAIRVQLTTESDLSQYSSHIIGSTIFQSRDFGVGKRQPRDPGINPRIGS